MKRFRESSKIFSKVKSGSYPRLYQSVRNNKVSVTEVEHLNTPVNLNRSVLRPVPSHFNFEMIIRKSRCNSLGSLSVRSCGMESETPRTDVVVFPVGFVT